MRLLLAAIACVLAVLDAPAAWAQSDLDRAVPRKSAGRLLDAVHADVVRSVRSGKRPVVVFDVDDTLIHSYTNGRPDYQGKPITGAVEYAQALSDAGARIVYLTARHVSRKKATMRQLRASGVPMGAETTVMMRPREKMSGGEFKAQAVPAIRQLGEVTAVFDNEYENVRALRRALPTRTRVFRIRTHSQHADPGAGAAGIEVIDGYDNATVSRRYFRDGRPSSRARHTRPRTPPKAGRSWKRTDKGAETRRAHQRALERQQKADRHRLRADSRRRADRNNGRFRPGNKGRSRPAPRRR